MITLTASDHRRELRIELPARAGATVRVGEMDMPLELFAGARYRNWTDGARGVIACQLPGRAMDVDPTGRTA